ncbi:MAG TPA: beta-galactosidase, partial [Bacteroidales bacterium]|nr:beta-galactosidase [Bacteroidales bacterium]
SFTSGRTGFEINGKGVFLRGSHDACIFPLTGYAPMDKKEWIRIFNIAKSYGINHYRFHSWCPPGAAFEAADETGMYLQPELPNKRDYGKKEHDDYLRREGELIFQAFGNHPSFVMFTLGNELGRNQSYYDMVAHFKKTDSRHLYAQGSNNENYPGGDLTLAEGDDFWVTSQTEGELPVRGSFYQGDYERGHIDYYPPSTMINYDLSIAGLAVPVVGHETGQFQVSPDFSEIPEYTGVLKARNYEIFRERLEAKNMLDQADDFVKASGALAVLCYREDIEAALRTRWFGGFQLLDLHDFSGQGTASVGILNVFMESKGLIEPAEWREFCSETVPLLKMKKYTWSSSETFIGAIELSHFGPRDLQQGIIDWEVRTDKGKVLFSGSTEPEDIKQGDLHEIDMFSFPLKEIDTPQKLNIELSLRGTKYQNNYSIWVYGDDIDTTIPDDIMLTDSFDGSVEEFLEKGGKVIFVPAKDKLINSVKGAFQTDFWCFPMFRRAALRNNVEVAPGTLGILCDPSHKALADFPSEYHSNWQWWHLVKNSNPVILDDTPADYRPVVQVIDNFWRNHKLGILFEIKVGKGKLLVCAIDLLDNMDKPEIRQFYHSIVNYADSPGFSPSSEMDINSVRELLKSK